MTQNQQPLDGKNVVAYLEEDIRFRSYLIWEREGKPQNRAHEHWQRAKEELASEVKNNLTRRTLEAKPAERTDAQPAGLAAKAAKPSKKSGFAKRRKANSKGNAKRNLRPNTATENWSADNNL